MIKKDKIVLVEQRTQVFVADDGTEFRRQEDCENYEREQRVNLVEHLKISEIEDTVPISSDDFREDHSFHWYKVNNEEEFNLLNVAYDNILSEPTVYPEIFCIEEGYDGDVWDYCLSDMFEYTKRFWELLGYTVSFQKGE